MLHLVSDGVSLPITPELILAGVRTGEFTAADTASVGGNTHEEGAAEQPSGPLGTGATLFLRPVLAPQGAPGGDAADTVSLWLAAALSCPTGFISVLSEAAGSVVVCVDGEVRSVISSPAPLSLVLLAVHYRKLVPGQAAEDDDGTALLAKGLVDAPTLASLEMARAVVGLTRVLCDSGCTIVAVPDEGARDTVSAFPPRTLVTDLAQRALKQWPEETLRGVFGFTAEATVSGASEVAGLAPREAALCSLCADMAPCLLEALLPGPSAGDRARVDQLSSLALLLSLGAIRLATSEVAAAPFSVPVAQDWPTRMPTAVMELALVFKRPAEMNVIDVGAPVPPQPSVDIPPSTQPSTQPSSQPSTQPPNPFSNPYASPYVAAPKSPGEHSKPHSKPHSTTHSMTYAAKPSTQGSPSASWLQPFEAYVTKRTLALNIDANDSANRDALETEYLEVTVNAGIYARDWIGVLPLAERWLAKASNDPMASGAVGRVRFRVATTAASKDAALAAFAQVAKQYLTTMSLQVILGELAAEQGQLSTMQIALSRMRAIDSSDRRILILKILVDKLKQETEVKRDPATQEYIRAVGDAGPILGIFVGVIILLFVAAVPAGLGASEAGWGASPMLVLRHSVLIIAALIAVSILPKTDTKSNWSGFFALGSSPMIILGIVGGGTVAALSQLLMEPLDFSNVGLPLVIGLVLLHVVSERFFFHVMQTSLGTVTPLATAAGIAMQVAYVFTFDVVATASPGRIATWLAYVVITTAVPTTLLTRAGSLWPAMLWHLTFMFASLSWA